MLGLAIAVLPSTIGLTARSAQAASLYTVTDVTETVGGLLQRQDAINDAGQIVLGGKTFNAQGQRIEGQYLFNPDGTRINLGILPQDDEFPGERATRAYAINDVGEVVGTSQSGYPSSAFFWTPENGIQKIESVGSFSIAYDINNQGQVVGSAGTASSGIRPFFYDIRTGTSRYLWDLYSPPDRLGFYSSAFGINEKQQIVGSSYNGSRYTTAFFYDQNQGQNLNAFISPTSNWFLTDAFDINEAGQIIGNGSFNGEERAFLLTPVSSSEAVPEPSTILGAFAIALLGWRVRMQQRS